MTTKTRTILAKLHKEQFALRDHVATWLDKSTPAERSEMMKCAGILTKKGKLAARYRSDRKVA